MGGNENASFIEDKGLIVVVALQSPSLFEIADGLLEIAILELNEGHVVENGWIGWIVPEGALEVNLSLRKMTLLNFSIGLLFGEPGSDGRFCCGRASGQDKGNDG